MLSLAIWLGLLWWLRASAGAVVGMVILGLGAILLFILEDLRGPRSFSLVANRLHVEWPGRTASADLHHVRLRRTFLDMLLWGRFHITWDSLNVGVAPHLLGHREFLSRLTQGGARVDSSMRALIGRKVNAK